MLPSTAAAKTRKANASSSASATRWPKRVLPLRRQHVDRAAIAQDERIERIRAAADRRPERRARCVGAPERLFGQRRRVLDGAVEHAAAPAVDVELDVGARPRLRPRLRSHQRDVRILRGDEREVAVVEHRVHDDRTGAAPARRRTARCPACSSRRSSENSGETSSRISHSHDGSLHGCGCVKSGRFIANRLTIAPDRVVQLDARRQALGGEAGLRPHQERGVRRRRTGYRRIAGPHEIVQRHDAVDLDERLLQLRVEDPAAG